MSRFRNPARLCTRHVVTAVQMHPRSTGAGPVTTTTEAEHAMRRRRLAALPVVDEHGNAPGVLALAP
ncbi:hypothetical protein [Streptomyces sp. AK04-3B]|uniref:hypothetical protein n=1 Tax=unclassified Streptomyces TaxID=2593676 RepID=UPI0039F57CE0